MTHKVVKVAYSDSRSRADYAEVCRVPSGKHKRAKKRGVSWSLLLFIPAIAPVLPWVNFVPVVPWGILSLVFSLALATYLFWTWERLDGVNPIGKLFVVVVMFWVMVLWLRTPLQKKWRIQMAATTEGELSPIGYAQHKFAQADQCNIVVFGENGVSFCWDKRSLDQMSIFPDSRLHIDRGENGEPIVTTQIRDRQGHFVVEIDKNRWRVNDSSTVVWDKNYTRDSLEVKDRRGHVVLQLRVFLDHIQLQGEWYDDSGRGMEFAKSPTSRDALWIPLGIGSHSEEIQIAPMFLYPSSEHLWEWAPKQP